MELGTATQKSPAAWAARMPLGESSKARPLPVFPRGLPGRKGKAPGGVYLLHVICGTDDLEIIPQLKPVQVAFHPIPMGTGCHRQGQAQTVGFLQIIQHAFGGVSCP